MPLAYDPLRTVQRVVPRTVDPAAERDLVGQFPTRDEAMRHALALTAAIRNQQGQAVDIKVEDESGLWHVTDGSAES